MKNIFFLKAYCYFFFFRVFKVMLLRNMIKLVQSWRNSWRQVKTLDDFQMTSMALWFLTKINSIQIREREKKKKRTPSISFSFCCIASKPQTSGLKQSAFIRSYPMVGAFDLGSARNSFALAHSCSSNLLVDRLAVDWGIRAYGLHISNI